MLSEGKGERFGLETAIGQTLGEPAVGATWRNFCPHSVPLLLTKHGGPDLLHIFRLVCPDWSCVLFQGWGDQTGPH